ncbi:PREDICTED: LEAF RUST 10 DISEASE-RESISTANCE LOCUS RECEPTOR-LIKE PROTEIN KINASE-like 1.4 isoform X2 [Theobroma cacao]|uniref:non-specific serine/threonine protein kinase n=1 Tax=Theobroma cacao TaxID=3641 RepID=A0AB32WA34_THECC|nr:PREDICTED: LEAF RUST 10 DISEASE-RESISTANCE LOCUS RECEPTOR-LIKE PROTEIN KINASE-like 1.4 isoform X2 [Theobroma cacao]
MHRPLLQFMFSFFIIISLILLIAPKSSFANDGNYSSCSTRFRCGNIDTGYPFWGLERPEDCGYPGFWLNCSGNVPEITIMSVTYQVLNIESRTRNLRLARTDYSEDVCVQHLRNTTLTTGVFAYNSNTQNMTLYYGCRPLTIGQSLPRGLSSQFECEINGTENVGYYVTRNITESSFGELANLISTSLGSCNDSVTVPVLKSEVEVVENSRTTESLIEALKVGFELQWFANDSSCDSCISSGGQCGYNQDSREFLCYCSGGSDLSTCPQAEKKTDVSLITGLGIAGAVIAGILLGMGFLCLRQRRQKLAAQAKSRDLPTPPSSKGPPTSTTSLSQSIPSYPTSNYDLEKGSTYFGAHIFSYEELEEATDNFNPSKELGEGGFGTVYYGVLNDGRVVAVKRLYESNFKRAEQYMNEIEILTRIRHPNLVTLYGCTSRRSRELLLVYEYIPNGTVADHLHGKLSNSGLLTWPVRLSIAVETANALAYLHAAPIIHRDVKTNNILLDKNFHVKVADFGLSRLFPDNVTHVSTAPQGTPGYVDPEYYQCYQLTEKSDVYSFGVVLIELISSKQAVDTNRHRLDINLANMAVSRIQNHALHELVDPSLGFEDDYAVKTRMTGVAELAFRCLQQERDVRPSMEEVLETLRGIRDEELGVQKAEVVDIRSEAEVVDIRSDDVGLLKHIPPPLSPDSINDKWMQVRSM